MLADYFKMCKFDVMCGLVVQCWLSCRFLDGILYIFLVRTSATAALFSLPELIVLRRMCIKNFDSMLV